MGHWKEEKCWKELLYREEEEEQKLYSNTAKKNSILSTEISLVAYMFNSTQYLHYQIFIKLCANIT